MKNKNYRKGARFERELVNQARKAGKLAFRSAGSHSPIDVAIIDIEKKTIEFIQAKSGEGSPISKKYKREFEQQSDEFTVEFKIKYRRDGRLKKNKNGR